MVIMKKTWDTSLQRMIEDIDNDICGVDVLERLTFEGLCQGYLCSIYYDCKKTRQRIETILQRMNREIFIIPTMLFKELNPSLFGEKFAAKVWNTTPETTNRLILSCYDYFPPAFGLLIATVEAMAFGKKEVASILKQTIKRASTLDAVMPKLLELISANKDVLDRLSYLANYLQTSTLAENLDMDEDIEKHEELNPKLFSNGKLKADIKDKALEVASELIKNLAKNSININLKDIVLTGSNASYNYTKDSDIDLHLIVDTTGLYDPDKLYPILFDSFKSTFNNKYEIEFYGIPVEVYIETSDTPVVSNGIYSVLYDTWVKEPKNEAIPDIDLDEITNKLKPLEKRYKKLIRELEGPKSIDETPIDEFLEDIYSMRKKGLSTDGEYSAENLVFKELRNKGYLDKIKDLRDKVIAQRLSIKDLDEAYLDDNREFFDYRTQKVTSAKTAVDNKVASNFGTRDLLTSESAAVNYPDVVSEIVPLTPLQYFKLCAKLQGYSTEQLIDLIAQDTGSLAHLAQVVTKYNKSFPMPYICFDPLCDLYGQEGRHRMYVLGELYGWETKFPVQVIQNKTERQPIPKLLGESLSTTEDAALKELAKIAGLI